VVSFLFSVDKNETASDVRMEKMSTTANQDLQEVARRHRGRPRVPYDVCWFSNAKLNNSKLPNGEYTIYLNTTRQ
jgi:hypothetical protein